ncbi:MAG: Holliday junction branch migration protein RuvA [Actinomycetota bacterium]|jgi:Holliday junction DNA helicase RuvA|nr:Holliday junction branch migration protein RuvA [Actinomycetota bacterium]
MIGSLNGTLAAVTGETEIVVEVHGVGYRLAVTPSTVTSLGPSGSPVRLHVHTHVREDAIVLYGFRHDDERRCFEALLGAHGVGPSLALSVLSVLSPAALSTAVLEDDVDTLCAVPGVGRKTAARLLIDLKSRLELPDLGETSYSGGTGVISARAEARAALAELGYGPDEIRRALDGIDGEIGVEEMLRLALRELAVR